MFSFFKSSFSKIKKALFKTRQIFHDKLKLLFGKPLSDETLEELERTLFEADLGSNLAISFTEKIKDFGKIHPKATSSDLLNQMRVYAKEILDQPIKEKITPPSSPHLILVVGVNGSGKTTTCAKLANHYKKSGKKSDACCG